MISLLVIMGKKLLLWPIFQMESEGKIYYKSNQRNREALGRRQ
jgi:hypothetical protein